MLARPLVLIGGMHQPAGPGRPFLDQKAIQPLATVGNGQLLALNVLQGYLNRTGPVGAFTDTWPNADDIIAALENPQIGDSWQFLYRNSVAQAMTFAAGTGIIAGTGTLNIAASLTRIYQHTLLSTKRSTILVGTTATSLILSGFTNAQIATIEPGMGVTGTNIAANSVVNGVTPSDTAGGATITLNNATTGNGNNIAFSFFPRIQLDSLGSLTA